MVKTTMENLVSISPDTNPLSLLCSGLCSVGDWEPVYAGRCYLDLWWSFRSNGVRIWLYLGLTMMMYEKVDDNDVVVVVDDDVDDDDDDDDDDVDVDDGDGEGE